MKRVQKRVSASGVLRVKRRMKFIVGKPYSSEEVKELVKGLVIHLVSGMETPIVLGSEKLMQFCFNTRISIVLNGMRRILQGVKERMEIVAQGFGLSVRGIGRRMKRAVICILIGMKGRMVSVGPGVCRIMLGRLTRMEGVVSGIRFGVESIVLGGLCSVKGIVIRRLACMESIVGRVRFSVEGGVLGRLICMKSVVVCRLAGVEGGMLGVLTCVEGCLSLIQRVMGCVMPRIHSGMNSTLMNPIENFMQHGLNHGILTVESVVNGRQPRMIPSLMHRIQEGVKKCLRFSIPAVK